MAAYAEKKKFVFTWIIENFPYCLQTTGEFLRSPVFRADIFQGTKWHLKLYPKGRCDERFISCDLCREEDDNGPETIFIDVAEHAFVGVDGSLEKSDGLHQITFNRGGKGTFHSSMFRTEALTDRRSVLLPQDTLTVRCQMCQKDCDEEVHCVARTRIDAERVSFEWIMENLSRGRWSKKSTEITTAAPESAHMKINFNLLNVTGVEDLQLAFEISPVNNRISETSLCKIHLVDAMGNVTVFAISEISGDRFRKGLVWRFYPLVKWKTLQCKADHYLPNDVMTLQCELVTSDGLVTMNVIDQTHHKSASSACVLNLSDKTNQASREDRLISCLRSMYEENALCDTKLKTKSKTFSAHRVVLGARSPVFKSMFLTNMQEKEGEPVDISDVDADIVERMLLYSYTGKVDLSDWDCTTKLYYAADKYEMLYLRDECSAFLKEKLSSKNVCDVLLMAEMHQDISLKNYVQDFISKHFTEVLHSDEWRELERKKSDLAIEMLRKICFK